MAPATGLLVRMVLTGGVLSGFYVLLVWVLRAAGFEIEQVVPTTIAETSLDEDAFVTHLLPAVESFAARHEAIAPGEAAAWAADLRAADRRGETFFSYTQYLYRVSPSE